MGTFLVAALAAGLVIALVAYSLVPNLSQYMQDNFPTEKNLSLVSVVAEDPNAEHSAPVDAEVYENADYIYTYISGSGGWRVAVKDKTKAQYSPLCETVFGAPVVSLNETFKNCSALTLAPAIPQTVKDMNSTFMGCTLLGGTVVVHGAPEQLSDCFKGTAADIVLYGDDTVLNDMAATADNGNVSVY